MIKTPLNDRWDLGALPRYEDLNDFWVKVKNMIDKKLVDFCLMFSSRQCPRTLQEKMRKRACKIS